MKKKKRIIISIALCILSISVIFSGCAKEMVRITPEDTENYDISIFFGAVEDPIVVDEIINKFNEEKGISIEAIITDDKNADQRYLNRLLGSSSPPVGFVSAEENIEQMTSDGTILNLSEHNPKYTTQGYPYLVNGYGLVVDKRLVPEISGSNDTDTFVSDLIESNYFEWVSFLSGLNDYIANGVNSEYKLNGHAYYFPEKKGAMISQVNGVFAFPGADYSTVSDRLINVAFDSIYLSPDNGIEKEKEAFVLGLSTYYDMLESITSMLAGRFAPGIRGEDFVNEEKYTYSYAMEIFGKGNAVFLIAGTKDYGRISSIDAEKAMNLALLPIKRPINNNGDPTFEISPDVNSSIPLTSKTFLYVNANVNKADQDKIITFIEWLSAYDEENNNSLQKYVMNYLKSEKTLPYNLNTDSFQYFLERVEKERELDTFLMTRNWNIDQYRSFIDTFTNIWFESR